MKWGEFQSVLQLATALNLAFFSLKEIRSPYLTKLMAVRDEASYIFRTINIRIPQNIKDSVDIYVRPAVQQAVPISDAVIECACLSVALGCGVALIWSCVEYNETIQPMTAAIFCIVGFAPVFILSFANYFSARRLKERTKHIEALFPELKALHAEQRDD